MFALTIVGFAAATCFAFCAAPQVWKAYKTKSTNDISMFYIVLSIFGNILSTIYIGRNKLYNRILANSSIF